MPRCKECKQKYEAKYFNQKYCMQTDECISAHTRYAKEQEKKRKQKEWAKEKKQIKVKLKTWSDYFQEAQKQFNAFIRERDKKQPCISCDTPAGTYKLTAGHFYPAGSYKNIALDESNCHGQCWFNCNKNKHGNLLEYRPRLIKRIGFKAVEELDQKRLIERKYTIPELIEIKERYKEKTRQLKRQNKNQNGLQDSQST